MNSIQSKLKKLRLMNNLTQEELANRLGIGRDAVIRIEKGTRKLSLEEIKKITEIYKIPLSYLDEDIIPDNNKKMKGIVLAGGSGTRLYPITEGISKQLMPIYDKPMIYYPLSTLMLAGIKDILIITTKEDQQGFKNLLKDGKQFGLNLEYMIQPSPDGLAQAFILGEKFIGNDACAMILGDNIFYGSGFENLLNHAKNNALLGTATIFGNQVKDPERFGIMELDKNNNVLSVEEKPEKPKSNYAITGLYFYPSGVSQKAKEVKPSARGELEITTLNDFYLKDGNLKAEKLEEGFVWFDTGTFDSQLEAANMIKAIENNQDNVICCPEKIAYDNNWINIESLKLRAELLKKNKYGQFLQKIIDENRKEER